MRIVEVLAGAALCCLLMASLTGCPQAPRWTPVGWEHALYPANIGETIQQHAGGGYFVAGTASLEGTYGVCQFVCLTNTGAIESTFYLPGTFTQSGDGPSATALLASDGYVYAAALTARDTPADSQGRLRVFKVDPLGNVIWDYIYGNEKWVPQAIAEMEQGGTLVAGKRIINFTSHPMVLRLDGSGDILWQTTLDRAQAFMSIHAAVIAHDGRVLVTGYDNPSDIDVALWAVDGDGTHLWYRRYDRPNSHLGRSIAQAHDGGFYVAGLESVGGLRRRAYLLKTDGAGELEWDRADIYEPDTEFANVDIWDMKLDDEGYIVMVGEEESTMYVGTIPVVTYHSFMMRLDPLGNLQWQTRFSGQLYGVDITQQGTYVATGAIMRDKVAHIRVIELDKTGKVVN